MSRYEWREGYGLWDNARCTYLLLGDDEHARILWAALQAPPAAADSGDPLSQEALLRRIAELQAKQAPPAAASVPDAMRVVLDAMRADPEYAWSWHCNVAMAFVDEGGDHATANHAAARFMRLLAGVDPAHELPANQAPPAAAVRDATAPQWAAVYEDHAKRPAQPVAAVPAGFRAMPIDPTPEMVGAGARAGKWRRTDDVDSYNEAEAVWEAMRDAAPQAPPAAAVRLTPDRGRVARAIARLQWGDDEFWEQYLADADAAIAAMEGERMTAPELPPLPPLGRFSQDFHRMRVMQNGAWCPYEDVEAIDDAREARERILLARIAELEAEVAELRAEVGASILDAREAEERARL